MAASQWRRRSRLKHAGGPTPRRQTPRQSRSWARPVLFAVATVKGAAKQTSHPDPVGYFSDPPVVEPGRVNSHGWALSFRAGTNQLNGTEVVHLAAHAGKLFAGTGSWMSAVFEPATVLRLDSPDGDWVLDTVVHPHTLRTEILKVARFSTDKHGVPLSSAVELLVAGFYLDYNGEGRCGVAVRNDATRAWALQWYYKESPFRSNYFSARALESYKDKVTGVDHLFMSAGVPGIVKGHYTPGGNIPISFDGAPESGVFPTRPLSIVTMGGRLYASGGSFIRRRNDGPSPTWTKVFDMSNQWSGTVDEAVGGLRGLTAISHPSGTGESLLFAWCPNGSSQSCMTRLDPDGEGFTVASEGCVKALLSQIFGGSYKNPYSLANYNFALPVQTPQGLVHVIGFQALLFSWSVDDWPTDPRQEEIASSGKKIAYYAGAGYLIRRSPTHYEVRVPGGPRPCPSQINPALGAVRCHANSPWDDSVYLGGYDVNFFDASNTAWVLKGTADAVHLAPVPGSAACTTTSTTTIPGCLVCGLRSREKGWLELSHVDTIRSLIPTNRRKALDGDVETWGGASAYIMDMQLVYRVSKLRIDWRTCRCTPDGSVLLRSSVDGESWKTLLQVNLFAWLEHKVETYEVDFHGRYLAINITEASDEQHASFWEIEMFGYADLDDDPQELVPDAIGGTGQNGEFTCQELQDWVNSDAYTGTCVDMQVSFGPPCCVGPSSSAATRSATIATLTAMLTVTLTVTLAANRVAVLA